MLEEAAGEGPPLFPEQRLILHRVHTIAATPDHITRGGKEWDTRKPLSRYFSRTDRVLLVDDDAFKVSTVKGLCRSARLCIAVPVWSCPCALLQHKFCNKIMGPGMESCESSRCCMSYPKVKEVMLLCWNTLSSLHQYPIPLCF